MGAVSRARQHVAWLSIGIPTIPRAHDEDYLIRTIRSLIRELPADTSDPLFGKVVVYVVNMHGHDHDVFSRAQRKFSLGVYAKYLNFITESNRTIDPLPGKRDLGTPNKPGWKVRKQTRDIVLLLRRIQGTADYVLIMEDDMQLCTYGLLVSHYVLSRASHYSPRWLAIRASFGMNGIFIHNGDILHLCEYLSKHQTRRPPDHLIVEWYAGETAESADYRGSRHHVGFRYNILRHIGSVSTLRFQAQAPSMPECYDELQPPVVFPVEAYDPVACSRDDITPCSWEPGKHRPPLDFSHQRRPPAV